MYLLTTCLYSHGLVSPTFSAANAKPQQVPLSNYMEPETNCRVLLLGCLHGSHSSARDVQDLMDDENGVDVVVLELCASRVAALRRQAPSSIVSSSQQEERQFSLSNFVNMVQQTSEKRGWKSGAAAAVLGGASGLQTALSGFEAGLEFTTALNLAKKNGCNVVLADQAVDETLARVGSLPSTVFFHVVSRRGTPCQRVKGTPNCSLWRRCTATLPSQHGKRADTESSSHSRIAETDTTANVTGNLDWCCSGLSLQYPISFLSNNNILVDVITRLYAC